MLRALIVFLLLANLAFYSWTRGWLAGPLGLDPNADREPQRLGNQIHPEALQPLPLASLVAPPQQPPPVCLEAGPFSPVEREQVRDAATAALPDGSWELIENRKPGTWQLYLGKFPTREAMRRRADDLQRQGLRSEEIKYFAGLEPGLVFGQYSSEESAQADQQSVGQKYAVRNLRVITLTQPSLSYTLHIGQADTALQAKAQALRSQLMGKPLVTCPSPAAASAEPGASSAEAASGVASAPASR